MNIVRFIQLYTGKLTVFKLMKIWFMVLLSSILYVILRVGFHSTKSNGGIRMSLLHFFSPINKEHLLHMKENIRPWYMHNGRKRPIADQTKSNLFPDENPESDRILDQLMYMPPNLAIGAKPKTILLPQGLKRWKVKLGSHEFTRNNCPVSSCEIISNLTSHETADAVLFLNEVFHIGPYRPAHQIWIMYNLECPYHTKVLFRMYRSSFNWSATYRRDSVIVTPYEKWVYHDPNITLVPKLERNYAANKTKKVAWFVSNCDTPNDRLAYARQLSQHISVDIYGKCGTLQCHRNDPKCFEMLDRDYKFYLAFENSNCRDYITEKFFVNGLGRDIVPVVMGARPSDYEAVSPVHSFIHVEYFDGPEHLAHYLHTLDQNDSLYNEYFRWKATGEFINTYFFCRVCALIHAQDQDASRRPRYYHDLHTWWTYGRCVPRLWWEPKKETEVDRI